MTELEKTSEISLRDNLQKERASYCMFSFHGAHFDRMSWIFLHNHLVDMRHKQYVMLRGGFAEVDRSRLGSRGGVRPGHGSHEFPPQPQSVHLSFLWCIQR